jgi:glycosyltransferase involved in cell wall biosynthesis
LRAPPLISLVTPSYNQGHFIERTICSVLDQEYPNLEYFIQDGGSTDETVDVLKRYQGQLTGWISEQDDGQSQAINRGFHRTRGEIMGWLNSDDLLLPGSLTRVADFFERHPDVDVVYGDRLLIDENDMEIGRWILPKHDSVVLSWVDYIPQETLFWRRSIWDKVGGTINESFRFAMDWDLIVRFRNKGARIVHIPSLLGAFRVHSSQKTSSMINEVGLREMDSIRLRELGRVPSWSEIRLAIGPYMFRHVMHDLHYRFRSRLRLSRQSGASIGH